MQDEEELELFLQRKKIEHDALTHIRKQSLDTFSRLHSIAEDIKFVRSVRDEYASYPMLANKRCGAWYCDPQFVSKLPLANGNFAHFKSTDGHYNGWSFNLRRPNLHILPLVQDAGGLSLVDSTRSGKRIPDSLSKTVPIWCTVINRALKTRNIAPLDNWDVNLYTPPQSVSKQEHSQIEHKLGGWAASLASSSYDLPTLGKPLRPIWITPASSVLPAFGENTPFLPIICVSASKLVDEGSQRRREGYSYVQGAGDDHENWSMGLTPDLFWKHKEKILSTLEPDFMNVLRDIVNSSKATETTLLTEWTKLSTPIMRVGGLVSISALAQIPEWVFNQQTEHGELASSFPCIIVRVNQKASMIPPSSDKDPITTSTILELVLPSDKKGGERSFKTFLPKCLEYFKRHLQEGQSVCVACNTGKDLSVGIALVVLQVFFNDNGVLALDRHGRKDFQVNKESLRTRLHWIIASRPEANPSRATLKRVNEFFMSPSHGHTP
ncbi:hypothetical protein EW145_g5614 [Phellinidium pouzarii]|uniref:Initiator tRNA phosphoribosyl transferase n=1 Tax=Phellinidium pouzarii TaxID=167371 RepID=A0A4V3XC36_9AGAM|nr:hypothetical protein EW145_g5614 [Phellinidium pouzarii]